LTATPHGETPSFTIGRANKGEATLDSKLKFSIRDTAFS